MTIGWLFMMDASNTQLTGWIQRLVVMMKVNERLTFHAFTGLSTKTCNVWHQRATSVAKHLSTKGHKQKDEYILNQMILAISIHYVVLHAIN